jgi:hypothetical protein
MCKVAVFGHRWHFIARPFATPGGGGEDRSQGVCGAF